MNLTILIYNFMRILMFVVKKILVEQKAKSVPSNGRALNRRLDQDEFGSGHVRGRFPLSTGSR